MPEDSISEGEDSISEEDIEDGSLIKFVLNLLVRNLLGFIIPFVEPLDDEILGYLSIVYLLLDPLFLYVPLINDDINCVTVDNRLKIAALVLRSFSDLRYLVRIVYRIRDGWRKSKSLITIAMSLAVDFICLLPIPQVLVLVFLPNMMGFSSLKIMKFLNFLVVSQYLFRAYPLYLFYKTAVNENGYRIKFGSRRSLIIMNFVAFLLASHVLGAFWYFFSIQRQIDCWGYADKTENGSNFSTSCTENVKTAFANVTLLCPINPPDASIFDFGIFLYALQSSMQKSTNFPQKFFQCFSWGLRNLSSFASNLNTSSYGWENVFVIVISISGLILFMYLLGHVQGNSLTGGSIQWKMETIVEPTILCLLSDYGLPEAMKLNIMRMAKTKLQDDANLIIENLCSILSSDFSKIATEIKSSLFVDKLKTVDGIKDKSEEVYREICKYLQPMMYKKGDYIIREGEPLDMMFFVTIGSVIIYTNNNDNGGSNGSLDTVVQLEKEKDYLYGGEELITWAVGPSSKLSNLPISPITVKCRMKVEVFALQDMDLQHIVSKFPSEFNTDNPVTIAVDNHVVD